MLLGLTLIIGCPNQGYGYSLSGTDDKTAHFLGGFVIQTVGYGVWKQMVLQGRKPTIQDKLVFNLLAGVVTGMATVLKELSDEGRCGGNPACFSGADIGYGMLGATAAAGATFAFDF